MGVIHGWAAPGHSHAFLLSNRTTGYRRPGNLFIYYFDVGTLDTDSPRSVLTRWRIDSPSGILFVDPRTGVTVFTPGLNFGREKRSKCR